MSPSTHRRATLAIACCLVGFVALVFGGLLPARAEVIVSNVGQTLAPAAAALGCWAAGRRAAASVPAERRAWFLLGASALSWSLGQAAWTYYEVGGSQAPFPSVADVGYLAAVPLALAGIWSLMSRSLTTTRLVAVLDGLIVAGAILSISWPLVLGPSWRAGGDEAFTFALSLAYPIGNVVVASSVLLVIMLSAHERTRVPLPTLAAALLTLSLADSFFVYTSLQGTEQQTSPADVGWTAGYLVLLVAALAYPRCAPAPIPSVEGATEEAPSIRRASIPLSVAALAVLVLGVEAARGPIDDPFLTTVAAVSVGLLLVRQLLTLLENRSLTRSLEEKIEELTHREEQLTHQAFHDPLTGLANRRLFSDRVEHALMRSRRTGEQTAVLFVDLDDFKVVNDSLGHAAGDRLLVAVASRLTGCVRAGDTVARLGGDEFGVLLEELESPDETVEVADRILAALDVPFPVDGRQVFTRASIGMALARETEVPDGEHLLADADVALYAAKSAGKAVARPFEPAMRVSAVERLELGQDLRRAVEAEQFVCHYQPIVDLVTGRVVALEALVRWSHPTRGLLAPKSFIELAEETGVISDIGRHVLRLATAQAAVWREAGVSAHDLELHVNLSGRQLEDADLVDEVRRALATSGFPAALLVLEITESVAVDIAAHHLERLIALRALGVRLAIDDFGTGYSSLSYLRTLPIDVLKIDRAFAQTIHGGTDRVLLEAIVKLGHSLGIEVVAEGIERPEQAATLRRMGCRRAQGYLFFRPVGPLEIPAVLDEDEAQEDGVRPPGLAADPVPGVRSTSTD